MLVAAQFYCEQSKAERAQSSVCRALDNCFERFTLTDCAIFASKDNLPKSLYPHHAEAFHATTVIFVGTASESPA